MDSQESVLKVFKLSCHYLSVKLQPIRLMAAQCMSQAGNRIVQEKIETKVAFSDERSWTWTSMEFSERSLHLQQSPTSSRHI